MLLAGWKSVVSGGAAENGDTCGKAGDELLDASFCVEFWPIGRRRDEVNTLGCAAVDGLHYGGELQITRQLFCVAWVYTTIRRWNACVVEQVGGCLLAGGDFDEFRGW